jgi:hypothetical protein
MRLLALFIIGLTFGFGGGFLVAGGVGPSSHDHAGHGDAGHDMSTLVPWDGPNPNLTVVLLPDKGDAMNLRIDTVGFTFTPETVNAAPTQGTGHAHIYIDGVKLGRTYSPWFHLGSVKQGQTVRVTLNADDHSGWGLNGAPIAAEAVIQ